MCHLVETDHDDPLQLGAFLQVIGYFSQSDSGGALNRKTIGTRADRWERYGSDIILLCQRQGFPVATGQQLVLIVFPVAPDGSDRVDYVLSGQVIASRDFRIAGGAAVESSTLVEKLGTGSSVNRAIDSSASEECGIGRIDDCVDLLVCYVPLSDLDSAFQ
jgi:hypothetical protein